MKKVMGLGLHGLVGWAYSKHTYRHTTIGFLADVKAMPTRYEYSKLFFNRWYRPDNCTIVVAGDVQHSKLVELVKAQYGTWKRGTSDIKIPVEPPQTKEQTASLTWPLPTLPTLYLGYHIPAADPSNPDTAALGALTQALFGETSPLYKALVIDEQKVVMLNADSESKRDPGLFTILARVRSPKDVDEVKQRIEAVLKSAAEKPIEATKLDAIKSHLRYGFAAGLESADAVALAVSYSIAVTDKPDSMNTLYAAYNKLTPAELARVAGKYFAPTNRTVITLQSAPAQQQKETAR